MATKSKELSIEDKLWKTADALRGVLSKNYASPDLDKTRLGEVVDLISDISLGDKHAKQSDILGRVYEYFLNEFASQEGKKGGEFYTPQQVSELANQHLRNGDTLDADWPPSAKTNFDSVVMNPPYSYHWSAAKGFLDDPRFSKYGVLAPKSKADYAFLLHGYYHLKNSGTMAIVLPHGVLFRGAAEGKIRQKLLEDGSVDAVIGLPANLFYGTSIPTTIVVLKKDKQDRSVMFIDASKEFEKDKNQNKLREQDIKKILDTYKERQDVERYAHLASFDEIKENDFNLNIPRYVDTFVPEPPVDLKKVASDMADLDKEINENEKELVGMLSDLTSEDDDVMAGIKAIIKYLGGETNE